MSLQEVHTAETKGEQSVENVVKEHAEESAKAKPSEIVTITENKEVNAEEPQVQNADASEGEEKKEPKEETTDHPSDAEHISEVKEETSPSKPTSKEILVVQSVAEVEPQHEGEVHEGKIHEGEVHEGEVHEGEVHEGEVHEGDVHEGEVHEGEVREGEVHEGKVDEGTEQVLPQSEYPQVETLDDDHPGSTIILPDENVPKPEEDIEPHPLDELTDQQVIDVVNEVEMESKHLELENILFENFLKENDPSSLDGLDEIMAFLIKKASASYASTKDIQDRPSITLDRQKLKLDSYTSITSIAEGKGPKINLSQKTDMLMRAMEESQASLESYLKKSHIIKRNLKSELEEFSIREAEIKEATDIFEFNVVTQGYDKLTQRIPAEKFVRYMEEWLKSAQLQIEKLRLRIATLKVQYKKVSQQLIQRQELGENVHAVDFDQLEIENKHFIEKIEQKNIHLIELKKMNGGANLVLSTHKKFLQRQQEDCNKLKDDIEFKSNQIQLTEKECQEAEAELNEVYEKFEHCKALKNQYTVPDVMEYVRLKGKLHELRKNMKIWVRRRKIQDIALNTCLREMKNLTGNTNIDPDWFKDNQSLNTDSSDEDMLV